MVFEKHLQEIEMIGRVMAQTNSDYISGLQHQLNEAIIATCKGMTTYALIDFPNHSNVGDSAIYLGELKLLREIFQRDPCFVSQTKYHVDDIEKFGSVDVIFLHGGGNFGDVWPVHQQFRERIIARYPDHKIVQLPQTLHFIDLAALKRSAEVIASHPNFTLLVRDQRSYNIAYDAFDCEVKLCPDSAMALGPQSKIGVVKHPCLAMLRQDRETQLATTGGDVMLCDCPVDDWIEEPRLISRQGKFLNKIMPSLGPLRRKAMPVLSMYYESWASTRVNCGLAQISSADFIITDRLHVHILSSLLGIEHIVLDNNYGKVSEYIKQWGKPSNAKIVSSVEELTTLLRA